jgi:hypothetical protein
MSTVWIFFDEIQPDAQDEFPQFTAPKKIIKVASQWLGLQRS